MKIRRYVVFGLSWLILAPWALSQNVRSINKVPGWIESTAQRLTHALVSQGFEVSRGYFKQWRVEDCDYTAAKLGLCLGNNPAAPYVTFALPPWPEEFVDDNSNIWGPSHAGYNDVYRLDPREAIVILAQMPPPARFFSEQSWVFSRQGTFNADSDRYKAIAADPELNAYLPLFFRTVNTLHPERILLFASLSNPTNNAVIADQAGTAFDQQRYFIITPDKHMNTAVRNALAHISVADEDIFTEPIPSDMNFGLGESADDFVTLFRYAHPDDQGGAGTPSNTWRKNLPMVVLRVRDARPNHEPEPYPPVVLRTRTAFDENTLQSDVMKVVSAVHQTWTGQPCANADCSDVAKRFHDFQGDPVYAVGPLCTPIGQDCVGDNWDATYHFHGPNSLDNGEIYAVAGVLGTETGNATYVGLGINKASKLVGVADISDAKLKNSASGYADVANNTDKLYLYYFTRDCSVVASLTGESNNCFEIGENLIPQGDGVTFTVRDYLRPGTLQGPDSSLILRPVILTLQQP